LYSLPFFSLDVVTCLPASEIHGPEFLELIQSVTAIFHNNLLDKTEPPGTLPAVAIYRLGFPIVQGEQACCVCALSATGSCHICEENLCWRHIYQCAECQTSFCGACFDVHRGEGHWSDSDTAAALADSSCHRFDGECSTVILPENRTKEPSVSAALTITTSLSIARCSSTLDKTLYLLPSQGWFSIFTAIPAEASR
jgi:hypothetical protein